MKRVNKNLSLKERITAPTPAFFKKIRKAGITAGAVGAALLATPIALPPLVLTIAAYLATAGVVATVVSSAAVDKQ